MEKSGSEQKADHMPFSISNPLGASFRKMFTGKGMME